MAKFKSQISASINAWAQALGISHENFCIMLRRADVKYNPGQDLYAPDVFEAITYQSEKDKAVARKANADAESREMENAKTRKELMELAQIEKVVWNDLLQPLRTELEQMPRSLCALVNPEEPETAERVLQQWVEKTKANIKDK